jgi:hypothetical protein
VELVELTWGTPDNIATLSGYVKVGIPR